MSSRPRRDDHCRPLSNSVSAPKSLPPGGRVAPRCLWQKKRSISVCSGLWATQLLQRQGGHRAPQTDKVARSAG